MAVVLPVDTLRVAPLGVKSIEAAPDTNELEKAAFEQAERAYRLFGVSIPDCKLNFASFASDDQVLLHIPGPMHKLWYVVPSLEALGGYRRDYWSVDSDLVSLAPGVLERTDSVWLRFNSGHGRGQSASENWGNPRLAGPEVLSALIHYPEWALSWSSSVPAPILGGYRVNHEKGLSVPYLRRDDKSKKVSLRLLLATGSHKNWALPTVSEV